jgi:hypothetical protein
LIFRLCQYRFDFRALDCLYFPPGKAGNVWRGALGTILRNCGDRECLFRPRLTGGPSGLADPPRPFVFRAAHLDGRSFAPGDTFSIDLNVFDLRTPLLEIFAGAFSDLARTGLGPAAGRVELSRTGSIPVNLTLAGGVAVSKCAVVFRTPTELKGTLAADSPSGEMPFIALFARIRDRLSTLRSLYGEGPLPVDFKALAERAAAVRTVACDLRYRDICRRSSRTGTVHGIGGFTGKASYEGDLTEFLPYLRAAWWTGVGRHTVWGNGVIEVASE